MRSVRRTLLLLVASGILAASLLTVSSQWTDHRSGDAVERALVAKDVTADILPPPMYLIEMRLVLSQAIEGTMPAERAKSETQRLASEYAARVAHWTAHPPYGLESSLLGAQHDAAGRFIAAAETVLTAVGGGDTTAALAELKKADALYLAHRAGVDDTVKASARFAEQASASFASARDAAMRWRWSMFAVAALLLAALGWWVRRAIWSAVGGEPDVAASVANAVARGDLTVAVPVAPGDTTSVLAAMRRMCESLAGAVGQVRDSSMHIATGSSEIAAANADLARRTGQQSASLQQTASSMEQLSGTVSSNALTARGAAQLAGSASAVAMRGGEVVGQVVSTMEAISSSSKQIGDIIGVIDSIAFQTNILALNAAVEAARAGEQGRGFAVVASEVRNLAQRSAQAAKEIKALIGASVERVDAGSRLVGDAGATMADIVAQVKSVTELINRISEATHEQTSGIGLVSGAVNEIDQATQASNALVEQSAAVAQGLNAQAGRLVDAVSMFKLAQH